MSGREMSGARRDDIHAAAVMTIVFWLICIALAIAMGESFAGPSNYNSYTLQAMAWREGRLSLGVDYPYLELAVYNGDWYVSFPPVPSVPMYLLTFIYGVWTPDALVVKLYALAAMLAIYALLLRCRWNRWHAAGLALLMTMGGSMLPLIMNGAVWYQAQTMAFMLTVSAVYLMLSGRTTPALFLYALAVGCRPFNVCYGPLLMIVWFFWRRNRTLKAAARRLLPGIFMGLMVAGCYAAYNYARFGNVFEFGHNYLPEFTSSAYGQFSLHHLGENISRFFLTLPLSRTDEGWRFEPFGSNLFLSNPMLILLLVWYLADLIGRRADLPRHMTMLFFVVHMFLLLLHRTGGGHQLGARYAVDLVPYSLIYLFLKSGKKRLAWWEAALLAAGFLMMFIGSTQVHI